MFQWNYGNRSLHVDRIVKASDEKDKISVENTFRDFILKVG